MDLEAFFNMGGYALYVWSAYGMALAVLIVNLAAALRRNRLVLTTIKRLAKQQGGTR
ncbi:MAG: heme exporter protein CcmD [Methylotetracoccus sp.]|nr:heme exporter protein CcmD [Methylotetracoccus sp.]